MNRTFSLTLVPVVVGGLLALAAAKDARAQTVEGSSLFKTYCASCHGATGRGTGPVAIFLKITPADLTLIAKRNKGVFPSEQVSRIIDGRQAVKTHGDSQMPVWGDVFAKSITGGDEKTTSEKIRALVAYLESIQEKPAK